MEQEKLELELWSNGRAGETISGLDSTSYQVQHSYNRQERKEGEETGGPAGSTPPRGSMETMSQGSSLLPPTESMNQH